MNKFRAGTIISNTLRECYLCKIEKVVHCFVTILNLAYKEHNLTSTEVHSILTKTMKEVPYSYITDPDEWENTLSDIEYRFNFKRACLN